MIKNVKYMIVFSIFFRGIKLTNVCFYGSIYSQLRGWFVMIIEKMREFGLSEEQIHTILTTYLIGNMGKNRGLKRIIKTLNYLKDYGYTDEDIVRISKLHPSIYDYSDKNINQKICFLEKLGYDGNTIINMTRKCPQIFSITCDYISYKIKEMVNLGYKITDILYMIRRFPQLLTLSNEYIISKFNDLVNLGYTKDEVIKITIKFPQIWSLTMENITSKKEFYDIIGISSFILEKANLLMQSIELSYARYMFYTSMGEIIDSENYMVIFCSQNQFKKKYKKTNDELIAEFPYDKEGIKKRIKK